MLSSIFRFFFFLAFLCTFSWYLWVHIHGALILSKDGFAIVVSILLFLALLSFVGLFFNTLKSKTVRAYPVIFLGFGLLITLPFIFMRRAFGVGEVSGLVTAFQENQIGALVQIGFLEFLPLIWELLWKSILLLFSSYIILRHSRYGQAYVIVASAFLILFGPIPYHFFRSVAPSAAHAAIAQDISSLAPTIVRRPIKKKNLVIIYLESLERTYIDLPMVEDEYDFFRNVERRGLSFTNVDQLFQTGFTIGGIVATQCGVPLVPRGAFTPRMKHPRVADALPDTRAFMPNTICLGDILADDDYVLNYINGSNLSIYGKGDFHLQHGYTTVLGLSSFAGWEGELRTNYWGMDDDLLFERATTLLRELSEGDKPFVLSLLTLGTHGPNGFPDMRCAPRNNSSVENLLPEAIKCTAMHVEKFLIELEKLGIADDTIVLLSSDHLAMRNGFTPELSDPERTRRNFVTFLGANINESINKQGTMVDIFPTLLEVLGYKLEGNRAGLGVSLLSESQTLVERLGIETANASIEYNVDLREVVWK